MYQGKARKILDIAEIGDRIRISRQGRTYEGVLMPRSELGDENHIVIKLNSGYNIGVNIEGAEVVLLERGPKAKIPEFPEIERDPKKPSITIIGTGGTIASKIDYKTGAVHPSLDTRELVQSVPELFDIANIKTRVLFNILSENMSPKYWKEISRTVSEELNGGADGVIIAHGTDTMAYTACALSFMLEGLRKPVVLVGSQRSSDRPSSDSSINLIAAAKVATSDIAEVSVVMHESPEDGACLIHRGTKVRKMHSSRRDAFRSINQIPLGRIEPDGNIETFLDYKKRKDGVVEVNESMKEEVGLIKIHPGIKKEVLNYFGDNYRGIVVEGTGLGHVPEDVLGPIKRISAEGKPIVITTQTLYGSVDMKVYSTGRRLLNLGVIPGWDMSPEVALVKLMHVLGQTSDVQEVERLMGTDLAGELMERSRMDSFMR